MPPWICPACKGFRAFDGRIAKCETCGTKSRIRGFFLLDLDRDATPDDVDAALISGVEAAIATARADRGSLPSARQDRVLDHQADP